MNCHFDVMFRGGTKYVISGVVFSLVCLGHREICVNLFQVCDPILLTIVFHVCFVQLRWMKSCLWRTLIFSSLFYFDNENCLWRTLNFFVVIFILKFSPTCLDSKEYLYLHEGERCLWFLPPLWCLELFYCSPRALQCVRGTREGNVPKMWGRTQLLPLS